MIKRTLLYLVCVLALFSSCKTHRYTEKSVTADTLATRHVERTNVWYDVSKTDTFTRDRIVTIILNEKGDTVRERELVYVRDKSEKNENLSVKTETADTTKAKSVTETSKVKTVTVSGRDIINTMLILCALLMTIILINLWRIGKK